MGLFDAPEPVSVEILGNRLRCVVCGHQQFWRRRAQLHTGTSTLLELEWLDATAVCYECDRCGYIHWFMPK